LASTACEPAVAKTRWPRRTRTNPRRAPIGAPGPIGLYDLLGESAIPVFEGTIAGETVLADRLAQEPPRLGFAH
jgi:hypothetical protein